jgi:hypothetical protein
VCARQGTASTLATDPANISHFIAEYCSEALAGDTALPLQLPAYDAMVIKRRNIPAEQAKSAPRQQAETQSTNAPADTAQKPKIRALGADHLLTSLYPRCL